ncbi:MAG: MGMT family protein [Candidatus Roizmanbacteria bacterium]|nr:MGMT family protein [Candidatus Roizmanbacteria bacterium]
MDTLFKEKIYKLTRRIPKGKVATYGQLALLAGKPKAARAVGGFMRTNPDAPRTPCHRVVAKNGALTGYSMKKGIITKKQILRAEGVPFRGERVDIKKALWAGVI